MAVSTDKQSVQDEVLGEFKDFGFSLVEPNDIHIELWFKDKRIAVYNQVKFTKEILRQDCHNFLVNTGDPAYVTKKLERNYREVYGEELKRHD